MLAGATFITRFKGSKLPRALTWLHRLLALDISSFLYGFFHEGSLKCGICDGLSCSLARLLWVKSPAALWAFPEEWSLLTATWVHLEISLMMTTILARSLIAAFWETVSQRHPDKPCQLSQHNDCYLKLLNSRGNLYYAEMITNTTTKCQEVIPVCWNHVGSSLMWTIWFKSITFSFPP